jgi:putative ABC transport system permease protein
MAVAGLVVSSAVQLPSRRRDAASLRVVGVPRRQVMWAVALEFVVVLGAAAVAGILAGTLAQDLVLSSVRLGYADALDTPDLVVSIDAQRLALWALGTAAVLAGGALLSAGLTVCGAGGATLRENAR